MKQLLYICIALLLITSCEDVIEVEVPTEPPRLTLDAVIRIDASEPNTIATINVGLTSSFFEAVPATDVDAIRIVNTDRVNAFENPNFILMAQTAPGVYQARKDTPFFTEGNLELYVSYEGQTYFAQTNYVPTVPIDELKQGTETLFSGNETEILVSFTDNGDRDDFYLFDFDFDEFLVTEDEFYQGQTFQFSYFYQDGLSKDQELTISLLGVDESFYNYMNQLIVQAGGDQGPFQTPAATVRGNIINVTDIDNIDSFDNVENSNNFALGYFAVVQEYSVTITIE